MPPSLTSFELLTELLTCTIWQSEKSLIDSLLFDKNYFYSQVFTIFWILIEAHVGIPSGSCVGFWVLDVVAILESVVDSAKMVVEHSSLVKLSSVVVDSLIADVSFVVESLINIGNL